LLIPTAWDAGDRSSSSVDPSGVGATPVDGRVVVVGAGLPLALKPDEDGVGLCLAASALRSSLVAASLREGRVTCAR
jgi:hypothetical protein